MKRKDLAGGVLMLSTLAVIVAGAVWSGQATQRVSIELDPVTLCPLDRVEAHTVLLADRTDAFGEEWRAELQFHIEKEKNRLNVHERFSIFPITAVTSYSQEPLFSICRPPRGAESTWIGQNPILIQQKYDELFSNPLAAQVEILGEPAEAPLSPILETIRGLTFLPNFDASIRKRRLIIITDGLQNTGELSFYAGIPDYDEFKATPYGKRLAINFEGIEVEVVIIRNDKAISHQSEALLVFWHQLINDSMAIGNSDE